MKGKVFNMSNQRNQEHMLAKKVFDDSKLCKLVRGQHDEQTNLQEA